MAHPEPFYHDPVGVVERLEEKRVDLKTTCYGCSAKLLDGEAYRCAMGMPQFPHGDKANCGWYGRRN